MLKGHGWEFGYSPTEEVLVALARVETGNHQAREKNRTPYEALYIYLLKGIVHGNDETDLGQAFLGNWVEDDSSFLFFSSPADKAIARLLKLRPELELIDDFHFTYEQWQGERLKTFKVADFVIVPVWEKARRTEEGLQIVLDPGVVFGSGLHPTTRDCLKALAFASGRRPFKRVLDLGTGTGILALAAARKGAESVLAIDLNPLCLKTAKHNVALNRFDGIIRVAEGSAEMFLDEPADLVVANLHWEIIHKLIQEAGFRSRERLLISGLMRSRRSDVRRELRANRFKVLKEWDHDMTWFTMFAGKA